ncbi:MAG: winged helix-turn-helix domain-containing protein [bacterium]|nr:winged helix-turn-helix domain-containing protein [bacterium]
MKLIKFLDGISGELDWSILRVFVNGRDTVTGRQMSYVLGVNHATCIRHMTRLYESGILNRQTVGKAYLYSLSSSEIVSTLFVPLIQKEFRLLEDLLDDILADFGDFCHGIVVFGDYSWKNVSDNSILELLFLSKSNSDFVRPLSKWADVTQDRFGIAIKTAILMPSELFSGKKQLVWDEIKEKGRWIKGNPSLISQKANRIKSQLGHFSHEMQTSLLDQLTEEIV